MLGRQWIFETLNEATEHAANEVIASMPKNTPQHKDVCDELEKWFSYEINDETDIVIGQTEN